MFIINLTYLKPIDEVEKYLPLHIEYLNKYYKQNKFICSGRKEPRTGGIILCNANDQNEAETIVFEDPFYTEGIAHYDIIQFHPSKYNESFIWGE